MAAYKVGPLYFFTVSVSKLVGIILHVIPCRTLANYTRTSDPTRPITLVSNAGAYNDLCVSMHFRCIHVVEC